MGIIAILVILAFIASLYVTFTLWPGKTTQTFASLFVTIILAIQVFNLFSGVPWSRM